MRLYIAGFFDTRTRLLPVSAQLREAGITITSERIDEPADVKWETSTDEYLAQCAARDVKNVLASNAFALDTLDLTLRGGREVEYGLVLGRPGFVCLVGPPRNAFHYLIRDNRRFRSWAEAVPAIIAVATKHREIGQRMEATRLDMGLKLG